MLQRYVIHLVLVLLFAFTQAGVAAHEISHLSDKHRHSQSDPQSQPKHTSTEQCSQCISYAKVANGLALADFVIPETDAGATSASTCFFNPLSRTTTAYTARAPPQSAII